MQKCLPTWNYIDFSLKTRAFKIYCIYAPFRFVLEIHKFWTIRTSLVHQQKKTAEATFHFLKILNLELNTHMQCISIFTESPTMYELLRMHNCRNLTNLTPNWSFCWQQNGTLKILERGKWLAWCNGTTAHYRAMSALTNNSTHSASGCSHTTPLSTMINTSYESDSGLGKRRASDKACFETRMFVHLA